MLLRCLSSSVDMRAHSKAATAAVAVGIPDAVIAALLCIWRLYPDVQGIES